MTSTTQHLYGITGLWRQSYNIPAICVDENSIGILRIAVEILRGIRMKSYERDGVSNHQPQNCLLNRLFRHRSQKKSKLRVIGLCAGNSPVTSEFAAQMASNAENISIWWRHYGFAIWSARYQSGHQPPLRGPQTTMQTCKNIKTKILIFENSGINNYSEISINALPLLPFVFLWHRLIGCANHMMLTCGVLHGWVPLNWFIIFLDLRSFRCHGIL